MRATRGTDLPGVVRPGSSDDEARRRGLVVEAGMLAFLVGLAVIFVLGAPS